MALTLRTIMKTKNIENIKLLFFIISLNYIFSQVFSNNKNNDNYITKNTIILI